ncbi:MAG: ABC transporter permease [Calditrichaceae bacterium]
MKEIWSVIKREYRESVFKKSFIIITLLMPVLLVGIGLAPSLFIMLDTEETVKIDVIDESGFVYDKMEEMLNDSLKDGSEKFRLSKINPVNDIEKSIKEQKDSIDAGKIDGLLYIPSDIAQSNNLEYYTKSVANFNINYRVKEVVENIVQDYRIEKSGMNPEVITKLTQSVNLKTFKVVEGGGQQERGFGEEYFGTFIFVLMLYMTLIFSGNTIMRSIILEKSSRIVEVVLSTTSPFKMMAGKILGQGFVGLTQYIIWATFGITLAVYGNKILPISNEYFSFAPSLFVYFVIFYVLGYFLYATLFSAIGAMVNTDQEGQQLSFPVIMMLIIPLMILGLIVKNPDSSIATVFSLIPFFSPIIMFARINLSSPGFLEIGSAIMILILTILFLIWIVAKIYRVGILMYGKRPNLPEIVKWMRYR